MQVEAKETIGSKDEVVLLSPTGTGKTLAFLLPILKLLNPSLQKIQALIIVPSRELAIQIQQVLMDMGSGYKTNVVYGGRSGLKDKVELGHPPKVLVGTPGRVADHIRTGVVDTVSIKYLILDEFDKSLEIGFEVEMEEIISSLLNLEKKILTSATEKLKIPSFVNMNRPVRLNYLVGNTASYTQKLIVASKADKLQSVLKVIHAVQNKKGIIFCNFKASIPKVSKFLSRNKIDHTCFHGDLEQRERAEALIKFRNGTHQLLLATDLAARGIDVPTLDFIMHYEIPVKEDEFIHRNGRTGRMNASGEVFILKWEEEPLKEFIKDVEAFTFDFKEKSQVKKWVTLYMSGGKRDKISKGDIAGLFFKQGGLKKNELGLIELQSDCAYVAVPPKESFRLIKKLNNARLKKRKIRLRLLD